MYEVRNISFAYRRRQVLRDVSFVVSPGETVSILGANGAGKTTLLKVLSTLVEPDGGLVLTDGKDALAHPLEYRRHLGYLPENVALEDDMRVKDYLFYRAELKGESARRLRRRVGEASELCRIGGILNERNGELSAGLRRRVALADALILRPRVLLLDDFLSGLDSSMRKAAGEILSDAAAFSSVIVTGHEIESLVRWTTRFLILRNGVISASIDTAGVDAEDLKAHIDSALEGGAS